MKNFILYMLLFISLPLWAAPYRSCRVALQPSVRFKSAQGIVFPKLAQDKVMGQRFVLEQFIEDAMFRYYVVRGPDQSLYLADGRYMDMNFAQKGLDRFSGLVCRRGDIDISAGLLMAYSLEQQKRFREIFEHETSLPENKLLCVSMDVDQVSLTDQALATLGMSVGGDVTVINSFNLKGQVISKAKAPEDYFNISDSDHDWRMAESGMYIVEDQSGMLHAVRFNELSESSLNQLQISRFSCIKPDREGFRDREITPHDLYKQNRRHPTAFVN